MILEIKNIFKANQRVIELTSQLADLQSKFDALTEKSKVDAEKVADYEKTIAGYALDETKANLEKEIEALKQANVDEVVKLTEAHEEAISALRDKLEAAEKASSQKATNIVASIGVSADLIPDTTKVEMTPQEALKQFKSLSGVDATDFYNKYQSLINQALK